MFSVLLAIIYMSFISLGLPDSLLGSAWPVMYEEMGVPLSYAGIVSMIIAGCTIISSLTSEKINRKLGTGLVTAVSVAMTAMALFGFSVSGSFVVICLWAVPYGLGAGGVDAALNNYVALHYSSKHMSWLHAFWGVGVSVSPYVMSYCISLNQGWNMGYRSISVVQIILTVILFITLPVWKKNKYTLNEEKPKTVTLKQAFKIKGVPCIMLAFFGFCAFESTAGLWASTYLVEARGVGTETAARFAALFYLGETAGRFLNGFAADKFGDKKMINVGIYIMIAGTLMVLIPVSDVFALIGLVVMGLGAAPVYPCIIHSTPDNFGRGNSQALVGIQMASAYCGSTFMPPVFGFLAENVSLTLYPLYLGGLAFIMLIMIKRLNNIIQKKL